MFNHVFLHLSLRVNVGGFVQDTKKVPILTQLANVVDDCNCRFFEVLQIENVGSNIKENNFYLF